MRTDDDTWDITTSVGQTALFVAAARALEAQKTDPLAVDPYAELFCRAAGGTWSDVLDGIEVAIDLRDDWPAVLEASGFDPSRPSAWIAEGLLIYLPADAQQKLFSGIDALASPGSWLAVEESTPMPQEAFEAKRDEELAAGLRPPRRFRVI